MTIATLFGKLRENEWQMNKLNEQETSEKNIKIIELNLDINMLFKINKSSTKFSFHMKN